MDNKATTKRMIGAVVLVLVAALLLAWLLKGKNRDGQQDMAMNQAGETKPILGFPGVGEEGQKPSIVGDDPNAVAQQAAGIDVAQQQQVPADAGQPATGKDGASLIPGVDVKLPETVANTTGFEVRPAGEVRDLVDTDGKVKDGTGSMGTGSAKAPEAQAPVVQDTGDSAKAEQQVAAKASVAETKTSTSSTSQQASSKDTAPVEKKSSAKVVLVNEKPVPKATSEDSARAAAKKAAEDKAAAMAKAAEDKAAAMAKAAAEKAAAAKSVALANAASGTAAAGGNTGDFVIQVLASSDKGNAEAVAAPLKLMVIRLAYHPRLLVEKLSIG